MIVHINQPRFLPALNYFQRMIIADRFIIRDDVQFQRKDWESRNKIKTAQGWQWLTVPVLHGSAGENIRKVRIDNSLPWAKAILGSIRSAYGRAPYFKCYFSEFEAELSREWESLYYLNHCLLEVFSRAWDIHCIFTIASVLHCQGDTNGILIEMCKDLGASIYLSGSEGRNYNRPEAWKEAGIELRYHDYVPISYPQQHGGEFMPWMSAIDLLMNCGPDGRLTLNEGCEQYRFSMAVS